MKELVTVLSLMSVGLWVVQDATPWLYCRAITSGHADEFPFDPKFVGFSTDGSITRQEIQRYRKIYLNPRWVENELAKVGRAQRTTDWQSSALVVIPSHRH